MAPRALGQSRARVEGRKDSGTLLRITYETVQADSGQQNEERKKLNQLRKEQEEERQLAELQRLQEQATGKKRVDKLDWMYAAPSNEGGALGNAKISQSQMEDYLLGKRRVDEVLAAEDKNVSIPLIPAGPILSVERTCVDDTHAGR